MGKAGDFQLRAARNDSREEAWGVVNSSEGQCDESPKEKVASF